MSDQAFDLLLTSLQQATGKLLWVVDENISTAELQRVQPRLNLSVICNRYDIAAAMRQQGFDVQLCDFESERYPAHSFDVICYRVSKEKALVHHIINTSAHWLKPGGKLLLSGFKNDGVKTYADKAVGHLGELTNKQRGSKTAMLFEVGATYIDDCPLDDKDYSQPRLLEFSELNFYSKPGVFGWNKVDKGSAFLIEYLPSFLQNFSSTPKTILDLGCGYGYLTMMAGALLPAQFTATDNNSTAIALCQKNMALHEINGEAVLANCGDKLSGQYELILCNPPFHQGFDVEGELTDRFLNNTRRLLAPSGQALFVVNAFIPLEKKASGLFKQVETLANNRSVHALATDTA